MLTLCATNRAYGSAHASLLNNNNKLAVWYYHVAPGPFMDATPGDSVQVDSVPQKQREAGIDAPINFVAKDSMVYDAGTGLAFLYGEADVKYQNMQLTAARITMNMDSSTVRADGRVDTAGVMHGKPLFKQGGEEYDSQSMAFNFKTKKGLHHKLHLLLFRTAIACDCHFDLVGCIFINFITQKLVASEQNHTSCLCNRNACCDIF